ncbi:chemotaxis protein CheW [Leptothoe kymatousa]|uniref:Chemotaxis protein CheW n=1 Tax=Leptothoe kymatousa TAU-MAC 1615 TaxID=2364775 RepID=A0ABS5Y8A3_9CYAN|nr:chemotaxis protein CheW [Leptothoe kymatousa]MBT9313604.1 chemotaxis protein CheW [Leptothoe kymatousa TAU-MAC 1615]
MKAKDYLIFELDGRQYGIETTQIQEIFKLPELRTIANAPSHIIGVLNLRGAVVPVIHLAKHLHQDTLLCHVDNNVIIIPWKDFQIGIVVHSVDNIYPINIGDIEPAVATAHGAIAGTAQVHGRSTPLLDLAALVHQPDDLRMMLWEIKLNGASTALNMDSPKIKLNGINIEQQQSGVSDFIARYCPHATSKEQHRFRQRAIVLGQPLANDDAPSALPLVAVRLGDSYIGIALEQIKEFTAISEVTPIPGCPGHIIGNMNLRGEIITLLDIRTILNLRPTDQSLSTAMVIDIDNCPAGIAIDEVLEVVEPLPQDLLDRPTDNPQLPPTVSQGAIQYHQHLLTIIDVPQLFAIDDLGAETG